MTIRDVVATPTPTSFSMTNVNRKSFENYAALINGLVFVMLIVKCLVAARNLHLFRSQ